MKKDNVYLVWNNPNTGNSFKVGELYKENEYELLKRSGAKLPTDNYEFVTD